MEVTIRRLARPADQDWSDITAAAQTGPARWVGENRLLIPFNPEPTVEEQAAIVRRLTTEDAEDENTARDVDGVVDQLTALADGSGPMTAAQLTTAVRLLARVVLLLVRLARRRRAS